MNIRLRLTLWYTAILSAILVIFGVIVYFGLSRSLLATLDNHLQREANQIINELKFEQGGDHDGHAEKYDDEVAEYVGGFRAELEYTPEPGVFWRVLASGGQPLVDPGYFSGSAIDRDPLDITRPHFAYGLLGDDTPVRLLTLPFAIRQQQAGAVQVAESYAEIQDIQRRLIILLGLSIPLIILGASAGGWFLANSALSPIDGITRAANQISAQDLSQRLNLKLPNDEVGRLAATFDKMLDRLEAGFEQQKRFIGDASHEMRTPLTILKGDVEVALNRPRSAAEYRETLEMVNQTTNRLTGLVEELLLLARADNQQYPLRLDEVDLTELLAGEIRRLDPRASEKNIALTLKAPPTLFMTADPDKLARLFTNLIDNAIKYAEPGDAVSVVVTPQPDQVQVDVTDTGPGIPPDHLPHLFHRFYRVDKARTRKLSASSEAGGAGLGLSIAQWLAQAHHGTIDVASEVGHGTTFTVRLPLQPPLD
ncbi:MAG TPA: ATP-binding protein [Anaerolineae bacterium]|nr:HAMP domain-containing protein [Anaerolineae bacterium]MCB0179332.1 HAMP domain-containing protein [Anaerolineae bacterium]MCB9107030.1 HAMP domain-containing protein [Anaerolineales bacterium]HRV95338.1 ATP-binding protein [Anaerolineae bacterium]